MAVRSGSSSSRTHIRQTMVKPGMIGTFIEWCLEEWVEKKTDPPTAESRAYDAYKAAWAVRADSQNRDDLLTEYFDRFSVPFELADPDSEIGLQMYEWFRSGVPPRHVKRRVM